MSVGADEAGGMTETSYASDLTLAQWELLQPMLPAAKRLGRPPAEARIMVNAILYALRSGCQWRLLPKEFGPWQTVQGRYWRWRQSGLWAQLNDRLRARVREQAGKRSRPTAAILDSQSVRSADHAGPTG